MIRNSFRGGSFTLARQRPPPRPFRCCCLLYDRGANSSRTRWTSSATSASSEELFARRDASAEAETEYEVDEEEEDGVALEDEDEDALDRPDKPKTTRRKKRGGAARVAERV